MIKKTGKFEMKPGYLKLNLGVTAIIAALMILFMVNPSSAQEKSQTKERAKMQRFVDEDGDGFNDLLPDHDGDGIPNLIDPDFKGHSAESLYMHRYMNGQTVEAERNRYQETHQHGEPGQYGPNDSTGHGGGNHHGNPGSGNEGDGGNQGGNGGGNGGGEGGGNQGGAPGLDSPDTKSADTPSGVFKRASEKQDIRQKQTIDSQSNKPKTENNSGIKSGKGGR